MANNARVQLSSSFGVFCCCVGIMMMEILLSGDTFLDEILSCFFPRLIMSFKNWSIPYKIKGFFWIFFFFCNLNIVTRHEREICLTWKRNLEWCKFGTNISVLRRLQQKDVIDTVKQLTFLVFEHCTELQMECVEQRAREETKLSKSFYSARIRNRH